VSWAEGVRRMVAWLDEHNRIENSDDDPFEDHLIDAWTRLRARMGEGLNSL
jgi:hypothetical protein